MTETEIQPYLEALRGHLAQWMAKYRVAAQTLTWLAAIYWPEEAQEPQGLLLSGRNLPRQLPDGTMGEWRVADVYLDPLSLSAATVDAACRRILWSVLLFA